LQCNIESSAHARAYADPIVMSYLRQKDKYKTYHTKYHPVHEVLAELAGYGRVTMHLDHCQNANSFTFRNHLFVGTEPIRMNRWSMQHVVLVERAWRKSKPECLRFTCQPLQLGRNFEHSTCSSSHKCSQCAHL
jgi:hypothetical protein